MSEERMRYHVRSREFLNEDPELPAYIIGVVEDTRGISDDDSDQSWNWGTITLDLADCYRRVQFNFDMQSPEGRANTLRKINLIAEVVNAVRHAIAVEVESRNARPDPPPAKAEAKPAPSGEPATLEVQTAETVAPPATTGNKHFFTSYVTTLGL